MNSTQYNTRSKNLFRERSISSMPSRQMSVMNIIHERESTILSDKKRMEDEKNSFIIKDNEISKLRKNLQSAVSTALHQRLENSKTKQEIVTHTYHRGYLQNKIKGLQKQLKLSKEQHAVSVKKIDQLTFTNEQLMRRFMTLQMEMQQKNQEIKSKQELYYQIEKFKLLVKDIEPLKNRIITLQQQVRQQKLKKQDAEIKLKQRQKQKQELIKELEKVKPKEQELRQSIVYFQRVNLDLQRKMEDFNRRQNDYIKQITNLKTNLTKTTADRNYFKTAYQETTEKLNKKISDYDALAIEYQHQINSITQLENDLSKEKDITLSLRTDLQGKIVFYKQQGEENEALKIKNKLLQQVEYELRRMIQGYVKVSEEVNLTIVARCEQIKKLKIIIESYQQQINQTEHKFQKFDKFVEEGSQKSYNHIREGFFHLMRANNQYSTQIKEMKASFDEKFMILGQERDMFNRTKQIRSVPIPSDQTQYISIFHEKTQAMLLLENSNDQLLKIKKDLQNKIEQLYGEIEKEKRQMTVLKLKTAEMFRVKKDYQELRKKMQRYQQMIQQQNEVATDLQSQISVLRSKNSQMNEKHFILEMEKKNLQVNLKQINEVIKELNIEVLEANKKMNEKNAHLINDSLQKLESAIKSLAFFFNCAFCGELPLTPVTLALCGHNYCNKCKQAYAESCYQCDTGQPIEKVFQNKFLKDAGGKYKFLTMVVGELKANFVKKQQI